jgi:acyl transferase domain-containing protein
VGFTDKFFSLVDAKMNVFSERKSARIGAATMSHEDNKNSKPQGRSDIAIVGIGCRFPGGVTDADSFWKLLETGTDAITEIPKSRWSADAFYNGNPDEPGKMTTRRGGFLNDVDQFDASFFGISPVEAKSVDPQ